ncbi:MAG: mechanosensitive ion channel [bacterium]|nr:mechanosensitive ion channel [bacterium]
MKQIIELLDLKYFNNTIREYLIVLGILITGFILIKLFKRIILSRIKKWSLATDTPLDDLLIIIIEKSVIPLLYLGLLVVATRFLKISDLGVRIINSTGIFIFSVFVIRIITRLLDYTLERYRLRDEGFRIPRGVVTLIKTIIWGLGALFLLDNLGFEVSTIIAGLGIGGIAVAMSSQAILKDLFNYFVILFDRPFEKGDYIVCDTYGGTIEYIGIKTTRVRSATGEEIIIPNTDLTSDKIKNYKRMEKRTVIFSVGVACETPVDKLKAVPGIVETIVTSIEDTEFNRTHLKTFGEYSLDFEVCYAITTREYQRFMDVQQDINLALISEFDKQGIGMPYPTEVVLKK